MVGSFKFLSWNDRGPDDLAVHAYWNYSTGIFMEMIYFDIQLNGIYSQFCDLLWVNLQILKWSNATLTEKKRTWISWRSLPSSQELSPIMTEQTNSSFSTSTVTTTVSQLPEIMRSPIQEETQLQNLSVILTKQTINMFTTSVKGALTK